jgi:hypothetical protein
MPLTTPAFITAQSTALPSMLSISDTSAGTDVALTSRRVYLQKSDGTYLVPEGTTTDYIVWAIGDASAIIDVMDKDYALLVRVDWMTGTAVTYTSQNLVVFSLYANQFLYQLTQYQTSSPAVINNQWYYDNKLKLVVSIDEAINAVEVGGDIVSSQSALDRAKYLIDNQSKFF